MVPREMSPLELVWAKDALCEALELYWGKEAVAHVNKILVAANGLELEREYKSAGRELMASGKKEGGWELVKLWERVTSGGWIPVPVVYSLEEEDDEDQADQESESSIKKTVGLSFLARGLGWAFSRKIETTTHQLGGAAMVTTDHMGPVTQWGEGGVFVTSRGSISIELAKAELSAIVRSKLGAKASKLIDKVEASQNELQLALAVGDSQRKLIKAGLPRLAAKIAKKWQELKGRVH